MHGRWAEHAWHVSHACLAISYLPFHLPPSQVCIQRSRTIEVMVTDQCGGNCGDKQLNIHALSFLQLAPLQTGIIDIRYRQASAPQHAPHARMPARTQARCTHSPPLHARACVVGVWPASCTVALHGDHAPTPAPAGMPSSLQVPCNFTGNITVAVDQYRAGGGGWIRLSLKNVAGDGGLKSLELSKVEGGRGEGG